MSTLAPSFLIGSSSYLQVTRTSITFWTSSKFGQIGPRIAELAALERLEKSPQTFKGRNLVNTLAPSFLNQSSSFLQVTRTCMKAWMSSNFGQIPTPTPELSALAHLKNCCDHSSAFILIKSSSFLQVTRTTITSRTTLKFGQIGPRTAELAALEHLEKSP